MYSPTYMSTYIYICLYIYIYRVNPAADSTPPSPRPRAPGMCMNTATILFFYRAIEPVVGCKIP